MAFVQAGNHLCETAFGTIDPGRISIHLQISEAGL